MYRFFVNPNAISDNKIRLNPEDFHHIKTLRLKPDETFVVCDGNENDYICKLSGQSGNSFVTIIERQKSYGEPVVQCSVYLAFAKGDRLDYAIQKSVELGATNITLFPSNRCVSIPKDENKKVNRLQKIAYETAKQCGRGQVPKISFSKSFLSALEEACKSDLALFFYELETNSLKSTLSTVFPDSSTLSAHKTTISIVIGPEGGFDPIEAEQAKNAGMTMVSLGSRILRCETAPVAALSAIMFYFGEM